MGLTAREQSVVKKALNPALTVQQIADRLSRETQQTVTVSSVKHTLERAITKLRIEPRSRTALVKYVLEFETKVPDSIA
jgi:DNA-binding NarL/FixJ family response regulator